MFDDFRLQFFRDLSGQWTAQVACPVPGLGGRIGLPVAPTFTRQQLRQMRVGGWTDEARLKAIGQAVWDSLMAGPVAAWYLACRHASQARGRKVRLVVSVAEDDAAVGPPNLAGPARLCELPVEALYEATLSYLGQDPDAPLARGCQSGPDLDPLPVTPPLRVLVAIATPNDKPPAQADAEEQAIRAALGNYAGPGGLIHLDVYRAPTRLGLRDRLRAGYHVLHFIGHGGFEVIGEDPTPRSHVCLHREDDPTLSDPTPAAALLQLLRPSGVRLVVLTSCSSAAPSPDDEGYAPRAFDGLAQRLLAGPGEVAAVVAMQFDLANWAAVEFSRAFYGNLVRNRAWPVDAVVADARGALALVGDHGGSPTWVTPVVYSRCRDGRAFDLRPVAGELSAADLQKLAAVDEVIQVYRGFLADILRQPAPTRRDLEPDWQGYEARLLEQVARRGNLLCETVQVVGGRGGPGERVPCRLVLSAKAAGKVGQVVVELTYPPDRLALATCTAGSSGADPNRVPLGPGRERIIFLDASQDQSWGPGRYELALLGFDVLAAAPAGVADVQVASVRVARDSQQVAFRPLDGMLFLTAAT